jgi:rhamnogalacturonyl hydrolase YesR
MKTQFVLILVLVSTLAFTQPVNSKRVSTQPVAGRVLNKGLATIDMGLYPGSLLMHGMSELSVIQRDNNLLNRTLDLLGQYKSGKIDGRGSFISYKAGGSGAAYLTYLKKAPGLTAQVAQYAQKMVRDQKRSTEGILTANWAKDSLDQVFIDMAFAVTPYLLYSGLALNKPEYVDQAVFETLELFKVLQDANGLLRQGRGFQGKGVISQDNWSRGNGWGAFGLAALVRDLPDSHPQKKAVNALAGSFFKAVLKHQNEQGLWHQEMTDKTSYVETSGSGLMLYAIGIAIEKKVLDQSNLAAFKKGLSGYMAYIGEDGSVSHTCGSCLCPGKGTKADYRKQSWKFNDQHAFGPAVLAFTQAAKMGITEIEAPTAGHFVENEASLRKPQTYVRYMPEANGNILWENDRVAFRVYGPPVKDRVSSGIDVWTKSVDYPITDKWYSLNAEGLEYHVDRGEGCDFFHVGFGRGNGGTAIWQHDKPYISRPYATHKILENTPDEIEFELIFDPWQVDGGSAGPYMVSERKVISMKMGTNLFKVVSTFETEHKGPLTAAIGISYADKPEILTDHKNGTLTVWESYLPTNGELGTSIIVNPATINRFATYGKEQFVLVNVKAGQPITYYVGAGWSKNPHVKTKQDWLTYLESELPKLTF